MYLVSEFQFLVPLFMLYRMHDMYGGLPSWRNPAKHPTSPHGSMAAGDCSDAAVQGLCAGRGMVEARGRSCWGIWVGSYKVYNYKGIQVLSQVSPIDTS